MNDHSRFLLKLAAFLASAYALVFLAGLGIERGCDWRAIQDPRRQLLWDSRFDGSRIVILGDSEFASFGVDSPDKTLARQLSTLVGEKVYSGALDGAKGPDIQQAVRHVADQWPTGTVAFVDLVPSRFFFADTDANYTAAFENIVRSQPRTFNDRVRNMLVFPVANSLFLFRNAEAASSYLTHLARKLAGRPEEPFFHNSLSRNRVWDQDGDFALNRFRVFEGNFSKLPATPSFRFLSELMDISREKKLQVVFVLTPLNTELIKRYAQRVPPAAILERFDRTHAALTGFLDQQGYPYLDLYSSMPSDGFADLVHTNEKGDGIMAAHMAKWLADHPR